MTLCARCFYGTVFKRAADLGHADPPLHGYCRMMGKPTPPDVIDCTDFLDRYLPQFHGGTNAVGTHIGHLVDPRPQPGSYT